MQTTARPRKPQDTSSKFAVPNGAASNAVSVGPASAPQLPPAERKPNRRAACSGRNKSTMRLQKSDTTNKLKTLTRSEEHTSELQSQSNLVCRLLLEKKKKKKKRERS